ncbi:MAG TPA: hypothetical protein VIF62_25675, partial [Labilithrix sp.]
MALAVLAGCSSASDDATSDDDLTSLSARSRVLTFEGVVYVDTRAGDPAITAAAQIQTKTAFGALLNSNIAVNDRELKTIDPQTFVKRRVQVVDTTKANDPGTPMLEVRYTYTDAAVVPVALADHTSIALALLANGGDKHEDDVRVACTKDDAETREDIKNGFLWYDWDPSKGACRTAIGREQKAIDDAEAALSDPKNMIARSRVDRVYLPATMRLARADTATKPTYPEYDRLYTGGVKDGMLVVGLLDGRLSHEHTEAATDDGWPEWLSTLDEVFKARPGFQFVSLDSGEDLFTTTVNGNKYTGYTFDDIIHWTLYGDQWPKGMPPGDRDNIRIAVGKKLDNHWLVFDEKVNVAIADKPARAFTHRLRTLFGADEDPTPHRDAIRNSDVVVYNGHSYIGYGPLDPSNFRPETFSPGYQILFFDSCVSYNYYEQDFFKLKPGGSKNLDMITNGIEAPEYLSGAMDGKFIAKLLDGSMASYQDLLAAAKRTDSLRVVDGEIDN